MFTQTLNPMTVSPPPKTSPSRDAGNASGRNSTITPTRRISPWMLFVVVSLASGGRRDLASQRPVGTRGADAAQVGLAAAYTGNNSRGIPRYARVALSAADRKLLRNVYGIEDADRLYVTDSTDDHLLKYDTKVKRCARCYVNSYRIGFVSIRRLGESWDELDRRVHRMTRRDVPPNALLPTTSIAALDPDVVPSVERMLADASAAGFHLRVRETYRSPQREAYLMALGGSRTHTLTSLHAYGRAIDLVVDDGNLAHMRTRTDWITFRRWVTAYGQHEFSILGTVGRTWDWPHVKISNESIGFRSIDAAIARAKHCSAMAGPGKESATTQPMLCDFLPHLPGSQRR